MIFVWIAIFALFELSVMLFDWSGTPINLTRLILFAVLCISLAVILIENKRSSHEDPEKQTGEKMPIDKKKSP